MIEENCFFLWVLLWDCFVVDSVFFLHVVASVLVGLCNVLSDLRFFFYSFVDFFQWLDDIQSRIFFPVVFFVRFPVSCFFKKRKVFFVEWIELFVDWVVGEFVFFYSNFFWMGLKKKFYSMKEVFYVSFFIYRKHGWGTNVKVNMQIFFSAWRDFMWQEEKL